MDAKILVQKEAFSAEQAGTWGKQRKPWAQLTSIPASKQGLRVTQQRLERRGENLDKRSLVDNFEYNTRHVQGLGGQH